MTKNSLGREIPDQFCGRPLRPYQDPFSFRPTGLTASRPLRRVNPGQNKVLGSLREAIEASGLRNGMTIGTHHHLRNGDRVLNAVVHEIATMGLRDITIAGSSIHPVHEAWHERFRDIGRHRPFSLKGRDDTFVGSGLPVGFANPGQKNPPEKRRDLRETFASTCQNKTCA